MRILPLSLVLILSLGLSACASTNRDKILQTMIAAGVAGAIYGVTRDSNPELQGAAFGGVGAAAGGFVGHMIWNSDEDVERLQSENRALRTEWQKPSRTLTSRPATFAAKIPDKFKSLVNPGEWKVSEVDQWVEDGENRLIHQNMVMELTPPSLRVK